MTIKVRNILMLIIIVLIALCGGLAYKGHNYRQELIECNAGHVLDAEEMAMNDSIVVLQDSIFKAQSLVIDTLRVERKRLENKTYERKIQPLQARVNDEVNNNDSAQYLITLELLTELDRYLH